VAVGAAATGPATVKSAGPSAKAVVHNSRLSVAATNRQKFLQREFIASPISSCLLIVGFGPFSGGQNEDEVVLEHTVVLKGVIDDSQELARQCDVHLAPTAAVLDTLVEGLQE
jgi:hypothetical protein